MRKHAQRLGDFAKTIVAAWLCACATPKTPVRPSVSVADSKADSKALSQNVFPNNPQAVSQVASPSLSGDQATALVGTWEWIHQGPNQQGDLRLEFETWQLQALAAAGPATLAGEYVRQVVVLSLDGKPFRCNGQLGFVHHVRVRFVGERQTDSWFLRETTAEPAPSACVPQPFRPRTYQARLDGSQLVLTYRGGEQTLTRRQPPDGPQPPQPADDRPPVLPVQGDWFFERRRSENMGGETDQHWEREHLHLSEQNGQLSGFCDRTVERKKGRGVFACSGSPVLRTETRYHLRGLRQGLSFYLVEERYVAQPQPCDNQARRLDAYRGQLMPDGKLLLRWPGGEQLFVKTKNP